MSNHSSYRLLESGFAFSNAISWHASHILVKVPAEDDIKPEDEVSDKGLVRLVKVLYGAKAARGLEMELANCDE